EGNLLRRHDHGHALAALGGGHGHYDLVAEITVDISHHDHAALLDGVRAHPFFHDDLATIEVADRARVGTHQFARAIAVPLQRTPVAWKGIEDQLPLGREKQVVIIVVAGAIGHRLQARRAVPDV